MSLELQLPDDVVDYLGSCGRYFIFEFKEDYIEISSIYGGKPLLVSIDADNLENYHNPSYGVYALINVNMVYRGIIIGRGHEFYSDGRRVGYEIPIDMAVILDSSPISPQDDGFKGSYVEVSDVKEFIQIYDEIKESEYVALKWSYGSWLSPYSLIISISSYEPILKRFKADRVFIEQTSVYRAKDVKYLLKPVKYFSKRVISSIVIYEYYGTLGLQYIFEDFGEVRVAIEPAGGDEIINKFDVVKEYIEKEFNIIG